MKKSKKSMLNFSLSLLHKVITLAVGILIPKLFITSYGSAINGLQSSVTQIFSYITLLEAGVGAATLQSLYRPVALKDHDTANAYLSATTKYYNKIGVIYFAILLGMALLYPVIVPVENATYGVVFGYITLSGALNGINFFYLAKLKLLISAEGDDYIVSIVTTFTYIASSALKILLILLGKNIVVVQAVFLTVNIVTTIIYYIIAKKKYPWLNFKVTPNFDGVKQKNSVLVHKISSLIFQNVDVLLLTFLCNLKIVSIYTMYKLVVGMITTVVATFGDSIHFVLGQTFNSEATEGKPKFCNLIDTFNVFYSAISFGLYCVLFILILPFMKLYTAGMDINYILPVLPFLYLTIELLTVGREAMMRTIDVAGHFKKTQYRSVAEAVINLVVSVVAILVCKQYWGDVGGLYGALVGTIVSMLYRTIDINVYANKVILHRSCFHTFKIMLTNLLLLVVVISVSNFLNIQINTYFEFFKYGAILTVGIIALFVFVQSITNIKETKFAITKIKQMKKHSK